MVGVGILFGCLALLLFTGYTWIARSQASDAAKIKQSQKSELQESIDENKDLQQELAYIADRETAYNNLRASEIYFDGLLDKVAAATPNNLQLTLLGLRKVDDVSVAGVAATRADIATFTDNLSKIPEFTAVNLNQTDSQVDGVHFNLTLKLVLPDAKSAKKASPAASPSATSQANPTSPIPSVSPSPAS